MTSEEMWFGSPNAFVLHDAVQGIPKKYLRPLFRLPGRSKLVVKETGSMGKSVCIQFPRRLNEVNYNYLQWKGVGTSAINEYFQEDTEAFGGRLTYPFGSAGLFAPLYFMELGKKKMLRFRGGAIYEDLLLEANNEKLFSSLGVRMPKIVATMKFTREFARRNSLPQPKNNQPYDQQGETLWEFVMERRTLIPARIFTQIAAANDVSGPYFSAILGQNIRAFRNIWRICDLEILVRDISEPGVKTQLRKILQTSAKILAGELGGADDVSAYGLHMARILGQQAGILFEHRLLHKGLFIHQQDVTLAGEICDVDAEGLHGKYTFPELASQILVLGDCVSIIARAGLLVRKKGLTVDLALAEYALTVTSALTLEKNLILLGVLQTRRPKNPTHKYLLSAILSRTRSSGG